MDFQAKTDVDEITQFLVNALAVLNHFDQRMINDPVFMKTANESNVFRTINEIKRVTNRLIPDGSGREVSRFSTQQG